MRRAQRPAVRLDGDENRRADPLEDPPRGPEAPEAPEAPEGATAQVKEEEGSVAVLNTCESGGAIEALLAPFLPTPRVNVVGSKPIAGQLEAYEAGLAAAGFVEARA